MTNLFFLQKWQLVGGIARNKSDLTVTEILEPLQPILCAKSTEQGQKSDFGRDIGSYLELNLGLDTCYMYFEEKNMNP